MAKSTIQGNRGIIVFDESDFATGLAPQGQFSTTTVKQTSIAGMAGLTAIDPYRNIGILQPGMAPTNATNVSSLSGQVLAAVFSPASNSLLYGIDVGGKFQEINFISNTVTNAGVFPHTIAGTSPVGQDCIIYQHNSGGTTTQVYSAFYSYYNNANWDIGALVNMTGTPDDDFMSTVPATPLDITSGDGDSAYQRTSPHTMCVGTDDILYIGSGRYIHAYDGGTGANGTFQSQVFTLPAGFKVQGMVAYDDFLYIAGNYGSTTISTGNPVGGSSVVYVWDYLSQDVTQIIPINEPFVSSIFIWRGAPAVTCYGARERNGFVKIKRIVGNQAKRVADIPSGTNPVFRGIDSRQDMLYMNIGGQVVTIGDKFTGEGYNINYIGFASVTQNSGWIYNLQTDATQPALILSSSNGSSHAFSKLVGGYSTSNCITQFYEPNFPPLKQGRVMRVTVYYFQVVAQNVLNPEFSLNLFTDYGTSSALVAASQSLASPLIKKYEQKTSGAPLPFFTSVALQCIWASGGSTAPAAHQISKAIVEFELEDFTT